MKIRIVIAVFFIITLIPTVIFGQYYFGQNKVQYTDFDWKVLTSDHFNVYFYPEEEEIAKIGANIKRSIRTTTKISCDQNTILGTTNI